MNKEEQKKLLIEMMEADEKDGLYEINNMKQQTALEWLEEQLNKWSDGRFYLPPHLFEQAKQMEKEQMKSIEPPSDEEIESGMNQRLFLSDKHAHFNSGAKAGFKLGAEWMKEQILNQNK